MIVISCASCGTRTTQSGAVIPCDRFDGNVKESNIGDREDVLRYDGVYIIEESYTPKAGYINAFQFWENGRAVLYTIK
jgi:hypothetical protein